MDGFGQVPQTKESQQPMNPTTKLTGASGESKLKNIWICINAYNDFE